MRENSTSAPHTHPTPSRPIASTDRVGPGAGVQVRAALVVQGEEDGGGRQQLHQGVEERVKGKGAAARQEARGRVAPVKQW